MCCSEKEEESTIQKMRCSVSQLCPTFCHPMDCSTPGSSVLHYFPEFAEIQFHWVNDVLQPSCHMLALWLLPSILPQIRVFSNESALSIRWPKYWSFRFSISPFNKYQGWNYDFLQSRLVWSSFSPRDSQESSPAPQFKSINSLVLSFLDGPTLTSIRDYRKSNSFDSTGLGQKSNVSVFQYAV